LKAVLQDEVTARGLDVTDLKVPQLRQAIVQQR